MSMIKIHKYELIGIAVSVGVMALALFLMRLDGSISGINILADSAERSSQSASVIVAEGDLGSAIEGSVSANGRVTDLIIRDVIIGAGPEVEKGDKVTVNYIATLQSGQEFDNSYKKGSPFTFKVGDSKVIDGWNQGMTGMKEGGQRIIIIPSELAYGRDGYGPIPGNATVIYAIELLEVE